MKTYIINPDTNKPVSIEDWRKDEDPTRAEILLIETDTNKLLMRKSYLPGEYTFDKAQQACAAFRPKGMDGITFRCSTRKECIDIYDARHIGGLDEAIKLIGGDYATRGRYHWTCEKDVDQNYAYNAWYSGGVSGFMYVNHMCDTVLALPVALLSTL